MSTTNDASSRPWPPRMKPMKPQAAIGAVMQLLLILLSLHGCATPPAEREGTGVASPAAASSRPNVVIMVADDLRADVLGVAGHPVARTPNLDRLAREGVHFRNAFSVAGTCATARASLLTGKPIARHGVSHILSDWNTFDQQETPLPARLGGEGYRTIHIGKWQLGPGHLPHAGYDHWIGTQSLTYFGSDWWVDGQPANPPDLPPHCDLAMATMAARTIRSAANRHDDRPFVLYIGFKSPHGPFESAPRHAEFLANTDVPMPATVETAPDQLRRLAKRELAAFGGSWQALVKAYLRSVRTLDDAVGMVLDALDQTEQARDTLVVFTSDQGIILGEQGWIGKGFAHEQTMHIPLLMRYPKRIPAARVVDDMVQIIDIAPTVLDYADVAPDPSMVGTGLRSRIEGSVKPDASPRDLFFEYWYYPNRGQREAHVALRTERHKLIRWLDRDETRIYDLVSDPHETTNLADEPEHAALRTTLEQRLLQAQNDIDWRPRELTTVQQVLALGPLPSVRAATRMAQRLGTAPPDPSQPVRRGNKRLTWRTLRANHDGHINVVDGPRAREGETLLLAVPITRHSPIDPAVLVRPHRTSPPLVGLVEGRHAWRFAPDRRDRVWSDAAFNAPLAPGDGVVWLVVTITQHHPVLRLHVMAPRDTITLPTLPEAG